jgi:hypothetical protein
MDESFGPDAEIEGLRSAYESAKESYETLRREYDERAAQATPEKAESMRRAVDEAAQRAERARGLLRSAMQRHPASEYSQIIEDSKAVQAPEMSAWQWFKQNPGILEARPLSQDRRTQNARLAYVLQRVREAASRGSPHDPMHWGNYSGPGADQMADLQARAAEVYGIPGSGLSGNAELRRQLESPYDYRPFGRDEEGEWLGKNRMLEETLRPLDAAWGGVTRWKDNFLSAGSALAEGRLKDAAADAAYAFPGLASPAFHRGGPGSSSDWRGYLEPGEASAMEIAFDAPLWLTRGVYRKAVRPPSLASGGAEDRIRQLRGELGPMYRRAARANHPDRGGSADIMKQINAAFEMGDVNALRRFAQ